MSFLKRSVTCGALREEQIGQEVVLNGWVYSRRDLGGLIFIDLRDRYGVTQAVVQPEDAAAAAATARELHAEYVVAVKGRVRLRESPNPHIATGKVEVLADEIQIINRAALPPFEVEDEVRAGEELRLKHRYLDLRRPSLQRNLLIRNQVYQIAHRYFAGHDFVEIETPVLMKSTPEGARDYLVPSRIHQGLFYALPQSPQIYKQLLMMSGFDRYMQIVKCFRDEDLRADRQPEFSQIDLEMSFVDQDDVIALVEGFIVQLWREVLGIEVTAPFPRLSYRDAMTRYGSDKPDTRFDWELVTVSEIVRACDFKVFADTVAGGGSVALLNAKGCATYSRKQIDELTELAKRYGARGLAWMKINEDGVQSPIAKFFSTDELAALRAAAAAEAGDLLLFAADSFTTCYSVLGALRLELARRQGIIAALAGRYDFLFVTEWPLVEEDEANKRFVAMHHPFTMPFEEDIPLMASEPARVRARAYDLVVNGHEVAGGSIRIHRQDVQQAMFRLLNISESEAQAKFGFLLDALQYGAPPHGGIAFGLDRLIMVLAGTENIRDVIAFPKTTSAQSLLDDAPSAVAQDQLEELGLRLLADKEQSH